MEKVQVRQGFRADYDISAQAKPIKKSTLQAGIQQIFCSRIVMNRQKLSNIPLAAFRRFLFEQGCTRVEQGSKGRGGHEKWVKPGLLRPIILQTHVDPVPELIVRNCLSSLGRTKQNYFDWYNL